MGTRSLTCVVLDCKMKVAQYGQFDGYPSGQGKTALEIMRKILKENQLERFKEKVRALSQLTEAEHKQLWIDAGADPNNDYVSMEIGNAFDEKHPELSWRTGANILGLVMYRDISRVQLSEDFANDSLFCEWSYVIDLDQGIFEVHRGLVTSPHSNGRFANGKCESSGYYPVQLATSYKLDTLPSVDDFLRDNN